MERPDEPTQGDLFDELGNTVENPRLPQPTAESDALAQVGQHEGVRTREEAVTNAVKKWVKQLVDLTGRNRLLYYRTLKRGTIELTRGVEVAVSALLEGKKMKLSLLLPATDEQPDRLEESLTNARTIYRKARSLFEERGIETLFIAVGLVNWTTDTTSATPSAPLFMARIDLTPAGSGETDYSLSVSGDWLINDTLALFLRETYEVDLDVDLLLERFDPGQSHQEAYDVFTKQASSAPDISVIDRIVIGTFQYTKLPMVRDLEQNLDKLVESDLVAAIAGDRSAIEAVRALQVEVSPSLPNQISPSDEFLVLDADSSQNRVINAALAGESLVVQGPPGTGKSQTIANLISALTARGKKVLFVAEKRAAIEAVIKRLNAVGLGDTVMDLHGGISSRRELAERLSSSLDAVKSVPIAINNDRDYRLVSSRTALVEYTDALHATRQPFDISIHEAYVRLAGLPSLDIGLLTAIELGALNADAMRMARDYLAEWVALDAPFRDGSTPWIGADIDSSTRATDAYEAARDLTTVATEVASALDSILEQTGLPPPTSVNQWNDIFECLRFVSRVSEVTSPQIFNLSQEDLHSLKSVLNPARGLWPRRAWASLFDSEYKNARKRLQAYWLAETKPGGRQLIQLVDDTIEAVERWLALGGTGVPLLPSSVTEHHDQLKRLEQRLAALGAFFASGLDSKSHQELPGWSGRLVSDRVNVDRLPRIVELKRWLMDHSLHSLLKSIDEGPLAPGSAVDALDYLWLSSLVAMVTSSEPALSGFDGSLQTEKATQFATDDRAHIRDTPNRVKRAIAEHAVLARHENPNQDQLIHAQARRKRGHLPLRDLFSQAREVLISLRPCWTMSPLLVSEVLPPLPLFDVAIFDEASQVMPADAIPTIMRASQVIVAGDDRQLPPTTFFDTADADDTDDDEAASLVVGYESILDVLGAMLRSSTLTWHYRSEDDRLIAFSNHALYGGMLTTFPGTATESPLDHVLIRNLVEGPLDTRSSDEEVAKVVDLMIEHAYTRPDESLGVIAMGIYHADRIDALLRKRLESVADPELDEFFSDQRDERAFVKNLERVQGDERDAIILSIGYTKQADGRLLYRFGPLISEGGERRLNVAVTRARRRMLLVSGFSHTDMDPDRSSARGVELLRSYLKYAESRGAELEERQQHKLNPFELAIKVRMESAGLKVIPQYGASGYRIDFAIVHPDQPGELILAVEADGASYHSTPTARDRDRLRQQVLERRGWTFHRIWSTDWFRNPDAEVEKVIQAVETALAGPPLNVEVGESEQGGSIPDESRRTQRPWFRRGQAITEYSHNQLVEIAKWILSDTLLRTKEDLIAEMMTTLRFSRRGSRITSALGRAADKALA